MAQFAKHVEAYKTRKEQQVKEMDAFNHNLGMYILHAHHAPKKYPKQPFMAKLEKAKEYGPMSIQEMEKIMKRFTIRTHRNISNDAK